MLQFATVPTIPYCLYSSVSQVYDTLFICNTLDNYVYIGSIIPDILLGPCVISDLSRE